MELPAEEYTNLINTENKDNTDNQDNTENQEQEYKKIKSRRTDSFVMRYYKSKFNKIRNLTTNFINKMSRDDIRNNMMGEHNDLLQDLDECFENLENQLNKIKYTINKSLNVENNISEEKIENFETNDIQNKVIKDLMPLAFHYFNLLNIKNEGNDTTNPELNDIVKNMTEKYSIDELMTDFKKNNFLSEINNINFSSDFSGNFNNFFNTSIDDTTQDYTATNFDINDVD